MITASKSALESSSLRVVTTGDTVTGIRLDNLVRALQTILAIPALFLLTTTLFRIRPEVPVPGYLALVIAIAACVWRYLPRSDFRVFILYICGFALFNGLRTMADATGNPVNFAYPIEIDHAIFGTVPTVWLQDHFYTNGRIGWLEWTTVIVYGTYFSAHYWVAFAAWAIKRDVLVQHVGSIVAAIAIGLMVYYLLPTSPPWFSAEMGHLPEVFRISPIVTGEVSKQIYSSGSYIAGTNDVAAMPSLHTALTAVIAMTLWRMNRIAGVVGLLYVAAMGFSLIYLGEHYFVDVTAGVATAAVAWKLVEYLRRSKSSGVVLTRSQPTIQESYSSAA